ncbi:MAG TPA: hypothetical protein VJV75_10250 [Candidatus Polarisedimenticolia bacterium]|nr:hypothetical protein [Candidatus Polarisedimenticolia bacterium]
MNLINVRRVGTGVALASLCLGGLLGCAAEPEAKTGTEPVTQAASPRPAQPSHVTVPQGTLMHVTLSTSVGSETSQVGDALTATTTEGIVVGNRVAIPAGSTIRGAVTQVLPGTKGLHVSEKGGAVVLSFDRVTTPQGDSEAMNASLTSMAKSGGKTAGIIAGSAAGGALLGKILGGDTKDAAIGAVVGGGIGTAIAAGTKGKELKIPAGTDLTLTLDEPLKIVDRS